MMHHEDLMKPANGPHEPGRLEVHLVCVAADEMLGQDHDKALEDDEKQVLLVGLRRLQSVLQLLNLTT